MRGNCTCRPGPPFSIVEKGHGRIEERFISISEVEAETVVFPFAQQVVAIRRVVTDLKGKPVSDNTRHWVTSIPSGKYSPERMLRLGREYWSVENKNHWKRDAVWGEDRARMRTPNTVRALALLRCSLLAPLSRAGYGNLPEAIETMARNPIKAIEIIQHQRLK